MSNKSDGTLFERIFTKKLAEKGYWAHMIAGNKNGQPFDVIACKNNEPYVFDCKVCSGDGFTLSRIEANQEYSMELFIRTGNVHAYFAIFLFDTIYVVPYMFLIGYRERGIKSVHYTKLREADVWTRL
jgi:Holliday junction resolvase